MPVGIFDQSVTDLLPYLRKDIRALSPELAERSVRGLGREAFILTRAALESNLDVAYVMPDDDMTDEIERRYANLAITREPVFLRWDRKASTASMDVTPDREIAMDADHPFVKIVEQEKRQSANWWRRIGAVAVNANGDIIASAHNNPVPTAFSSWIDSDPRITASRGESIERSIDIHAESALIAEAAKTGISLDGAELYVSTFPCPNCAKLIAQSSIKACYFMEGYAMVDGLAVLKAADVEIIKVTVDDAAPEDPRALRPYV